MPGSHVTARHAWLAARAVALAWLLVSPTQAIETMPFSAVRPGMHGTGRTVFSGSKVESFEVEVLGTLPNVGPDQNLILVRLTGGPLAETGVLAGMSGSPVIVEGKLVGAVAYSWGFSKEAIAGVTPIEEMLAIVADDVRGTSRGTSALPTRADLLAIQAGERLKTFLAELSARILPERPLRSPIPLSVTGLGLEGVSFVSGALSRAGFFAVPSGAPDPSPEPSPPLAPGAAMGLKLVRGDVDLTATGTVTWVEGDQLLAFGHPLFGLGSVDLPLTGARVEALLPSAEQSARIARPLAEVGAVRQDRAAGIAGRIGANPRMIPVRLQLSGTDGADHTFAFDVADDPLLSPLLFYVALNGVLASKERAFGNATLRLREGSAILLRGSEPVALDNLYAGPTAFEYGTGISTYILYLLMNNTWAQPQIAGVNLLLEYEEAPRLSRIRRAALDRYRAGPGETVRVTVVLSPYRGPDRLLTREIVIPPETPPGPLSITIGGALAVGRDEDLDEPVAPRDLDQLIWLINQLRRNDQIYILGRREDSGVLVGVDRLPNLPPSVARVLSRPRSSGNVTPMPLRAVLEEVIPADQAVEGLVRVELEIEGR